jgi:predicted transposase/invertase (TIGR01784 family)
MAAQPEKREIEDTERLPLDIRYDGVFKAVFTNEEPESRAALSKLLSAAIGRELTVESVRQNEPATRFRGDKQLRYDINCVFTDNSRCNVEMTLHVLSFETTRLEFHLGKLFTAQAIKGLTYGDLAATYQVAIVNEKLFPDTAYCHSFSYYDHEHGVSLGGRTRIVTLELSKIEAIARTKTVQDMTPLERWLAYFRYNVDQSDSAKELIKQITQQEEGVEMAANMLRTFTEDEIRYFDLMSEMKYEMDHNSLIQDYEQRGIEIGRKEEREKADAERAATVKALRESGVSEEIIAKTFGARGY